MKNIILIRGFRDPKPRSNGMPPASSATTRLDEKNDEARSIRSSSQQVISKMQRLSMMVALTMSFRIEPRAQRVKIPTMTEPRASSTALLKSVTRDSRSSSVWRDKARMHVTRFSLLSPCHRTSISSWKVL